MSFKAVGIPVCTVFAIIGALRELRQCRTDRLQLDAYVRPVLQNAIKGAIWGAVATAVFCNRGKISNGMTSAKEGMGNTLKHIRELHQVTALQIRILAAFSKAI